jgi:hypothetical protein
MLYRTLLTISRASILLRGKKVGAPNTPKKSKSIPLRKKSIKSKTAAAAGRFATSTETVSPSELAMEPRYLEAIHKGRDLTLDLTPELAYKRDRLEQLWCEYERNRWAILDEHEKTFLKTKQAAMEALKIADLALYEEATKPVELKIPPNLRPPFFTPPTREL